VSHWLIKSEPDVFSTDSGTGRAGGKERPRAADRTAAHNAAMTCRIEIPPPPRPPGASAAPLPDPLAWVADDLAARFPGLDIVMAHPSVPWQDEALAVATHKANVWIDLSGWSPKYFPENLVRQANSILQNKVLFGSDFPLITPDRWLGDFANLTIKDEVRPKILKDNAVRLLGLA
jgi:predicted TIM-barrel fold metal-dependent hydrolase